MVNIHACLLISMLACVLPPPAMAATPRRHPEHRRLTLYFRDLLNITDYMTVGGVPGTAPLTPTTSAFGSVFTVQDRVALSPSDFLSSSADHHGHGLIVGAVMGTFTVVSMDGVAFFSLLTFSFNRTSALFPFHGTLSVHGLLSVVNPPLSASIVGGTGSFLLAQGSATLTPVGTPSFNVTLKIVLDVYWPKHTV